MYHVTIDLLSFEFALRGHRYNPPLLMEKYQP